MSFLHEPGDLSGTPLAAILLEALNLRATGVLEVAQGAGTSRLWFRDGRPVGAQVVTGFRPLGLALVQAGLIDVEALSGSLARMAETKRPQGEILVELGAVSAEDVRRVLAEQQAEYFRIIASLETGPFVFDAGAVVPEWTRGSHLSPVRTIVDALERPQARDLVASALGPAEAGGVRLSSAYEGAADAFRWSDGERTLVARLASPTSLDALLTAADVGAERARAIVAALLLLGLAAPAGDPRTAGDTAGLGPEAKAEADAPFTAPPPREAPPAEARARRHRLLQQAMRNMGVGPFAARAAASPPPPQGAAPPSPPSAGGGVDGAEAELRAALLAVAPRATERDLFARLGLPATAGREDAKRAFLQLARQFHPDRFASPSLADVQDVVKDFFAAVNEAYEILSDDAKRNEYLDRRKGGARANADSARVDFQKAEACLRTHDFARARGFLEAAVRADPRAEYQAALALACIADPRRKDRERAQALLAEAMKDVSCDRAHYVAGLLARDDGDYGAAERSFRAAVKANPRNAEAVRELRLLEARRAEKRR
jgi:tetratricopeptide (TPR) repeat protein